MAAQPIPEEYAGLIPYLSVDDAAAAIEYYKKAFGAKERARIDAPGGKIGHAELELGGSVLMLSDPLPQFLARPPKEVGGTSVSISMYVEDVDAVVKQAADAGATITMTPEDQFWGDRLGRFTDPFGHEWLISTHVEDLTPDEIEARGRELLAPAA